MDVSASTSTSGALPKAAANDNNASKSEPQSLPQTVAMVNPKVTNEAEIIKRRLIIDGDGTGDDKRLTTLTQTYLALVDAENVEDIADRVNAIVVYETYKSLLKQTSGIRSNVAKTYHAIITNAKASSYWESIKASTVTQMEELKTLILALRQKEADIKRKKKECEERDALVKLLNQNQSKKRDELTRELEEMRKEYGELLIIHAELDEKVNEKKSSLNHLFDLVKRLDDEDMQVKEDAVTEAEERVMSDVSLDLD